MRTLLVLSLLCVGVMPERYSKNYYLQTSKTVDWMTAFQTCRQKGLRLATIPNQGEQDSIVRYIDYNNAAGTFWIGGSDLLLDDRYMWHGTGTVMQYTHWGTNQPASNRGAYNCIFMNRNGWYVTTCGAKHFFICEDKL